MDPHFAKYRPKAPYCDGSGEAPLRCLDKAESIAYADSLPNFYHSKKTYYKTQGDDIRLGVCGQCGGTFSITKTTKFTDSPKLQRHKDEPNGKADMETFLMVENIAYGRLLALCRVLNSDPAEWAHTVLVNEIEAQIAQLEEAAGKKKEEPK